MTYKQAAFLIFAAVLPAACVESPDAVLFTGPQVSVVAGEYAAGGSSGEFIYSAKGKTWDLIKEGSVVSLKIFQNGTTSGRIFVPAENANAQNYEAELSGIWGMRNDSVFFTHSGPQTVVSTMAWKWVEGKLTAERQYSDGYVKLVLVR